MLLSRGIPLSSLKPARTNLNGPDRGAIAHLLSWSTNVGAFPGCDEARRKARPSALSVRFTAVDYPPPGFHDRKRGPPLAH
jgi:hypothetical protein